MQLNLGTELQGGKYRIIRVLGQGGFGITYLALHTMLDKQVAIKEFFPKEYCDRKDTTHVTIGTQNSTQLVGQLKNKFIKEARNISKLHHSNIITIHDIFEENDTAYYVMEFIEGSSLSELVKSRGAIPEAEALRYIRQIADAVMYMHKLSMNHLDLKPANIMLRQVDDQPILIDFGLSKQYDASGGQTSTTPVGISHGYAPIEQYRPGGVASFTPQTDVYGLGATLFNLLTGQVPPHYSDILEEGLPEFSEAVSASTQNAVKHAMEVRKNNRPQSVEAFLWELQTSENPEHENKAKTHIHRPPVQEIKVETHEEESHEAETKLLVDSVLQPPQFKGSISSNDSGEDANLQKEQKAVVNDVEFVDLGLSVLWATKNIGARRPSEPGRFFDSDIEEETKIVLDFTLKGAKIPTNAQWEELILNCTWELTEINGAMGYKVFGKNGNWIFLPFAAIDQIFGLKAFDRLFSHESFFKSASAEYFYYFYFSMWGARKLTKYSQKYICPVRLVHSKI